MESIQLSSLLLGFAFYYPLCMAWLWMTAGVYYYFHWERKDGPRGAGEPPPLAHYPACSIIVPCYNEGDNLHDTIAWLDEQNWPDFEIIAVNDGSRDDTGAILEELQQQYPRLRVLHQARNLGKAMALRAGAMIARNEYLICIDGDALLDRNCTAWLMSHLVMSDRVGAVTGNPRIRTRSTLLGKLQVGEFSSIIGLIKRAQRIYGRIFTVSGVVTGFRRTALHQVDYWNIDMITEDIDISWRLQMAFWDIRYEPNALCWILMPETLKGLWGQRLRWSQGGVEALLRHGKVLLSWDKRRFWGVFIEFTTSVIWAYCMATVILLWAVGKVVTLPDAWHISSLIPAWHGMMLALTCMLQFFVSLQIDRRYEARIGRKIFWMIWYPLAYWLLSMLTTIIATPKAILRKRGAPATWVSPDRGLQSRPAKTAAPQTEGQAPP
ncbi:MAG TPA: poly-beta-1,6-N-acetyl-D-glucosamine synthase [Cellvibrionaceae bacterium]